MNDLPLARHADRLIFTCVCLATRATHNTVIYLGIFSLSLLSGSVVVKMRKFYVCCILLEPL
jgi:hypothetical protein